MREARFSAATMEADAYAVEVAQRLRVAEAVDYRWQREWAERHLKEMRAAVATIERCADRMTTCPARSRFAYASAITKARHKFDRAESELRRYA